MRIRKDGYRRRYGRQRMARPADPRASRRVVIARRPWQSRLVDVQQRKERADMGGLCAAVKEAFQKEGKLPPAYFEPVGEENRMISFGRSIAVALIGVAAITASAGTARAAAPILIKSCTVEKPKPFSHMAGGTRIEWVNLGGKTASTVTF